MAGVGAVQVRPNRHRSCPGPQHPRTRHPGLDPGPERMFTCVKLKQPRGLLKVWTFSIYLLPQASDVVVFHRSRQKTGTKRWPTWSGSWRTTEPSARRTVPWPPRSGRLEDGPGTGRGQVGAGDRTGTGRAGAVTPGSPQPAASLWTPSSHGQMWGLASRGRCQAPSV